MPGGYPAQGRLSSLLKSSWAVNCNRDSDQKWLMSVCTTVSSCVQGGFFSKRSYCMWLKLCFYVIKRMKVKFKVMSLPDDDILINHVTYILHIQWSMFKCWFSKIACYFWNLFQLEINKTCLKTCCMGVAWLVIISLSCTSQLWCSN